MKPFTGFAFQINTQADYQLVLALSPTYSFISYENLKGYFYVMDGKLKGSTIPPGVFTENQIKKMHFSTVDIFLLDKD